MASGRRDGRVRDRDGVMMTEFGKRLDSTTRQPAQHCAPVMRQNASVPLTVIVPVFNEVATVDRLLARVLASDCEMEIIVVDDGSSNATGELLMEWEKKPEIVLLRHSVNRGKGAAIRTGLAEARGQLVIVQDADLEYDPSEYSRLIQPLLDGIADVVYGSRRLGSPRGGREWLNPFYHGVSTLNFVTWLLYGVRLTDEATCYKTLPTELLRRMELECERFEFCPEVTAKACRMKLRIVEVPIGYRRRSTREGKKIRFRDWIEAVATLWKWRRWRPKAPHPVVENAEAAESIACTEDRTKTVSP